ncbi:MAG TPA: O-antigen ligase family protein [Bryobacteraceae bacterium]|nr:O-antigen ligase family protein [Bryobacteraceae bacterium]
MAILLSAILALLPLTLAPGLLFHYDITPKIVVLLAGTAVALILAWREPHAESHGLRLFGWLLAAQAASLALSTAFSSDPALSLGGNAWRRFGLVTQAAMLLFVWFSAQYAAGHPERVRLLLRVMAMAGIPAAAYGILQYFGWDPFINRSLYHIGKAPLTIVRPPGTLGYVSYFATYLLSVIFAGAGLILLEEAAWWKIAGTAAVLLGTVAVIFTGTRAALLGLAAGTLLLVFWLRPKMRKNLLVAGAIAVLGLASFYFSPAGEMLRSRTRWFVEDPTGGGRLLLWRDSLRMCAARWLVGFGPETFSIHFPRYQSADLARAYPGFYQESPHNIFIDALAGQGLPGLAIFIAVTALGLYSIWIVRQRRLGAILGAALVALLISQEFTSFTLPTALFFYVTIALLIALAFPPARSNTPKISVLSKILNAAPAAVFLAFAVALCAADAGLAQVDRLIRAGKLREASAVYAYVLRWQPPGVRSDLWYSRAIAGAAAGARNGAESVAALQEALEAAVRASRNSEEPENAWLNLAVFYGRRNDFLHTEQSLRAAIFSAPNWFKPHWLLAQVLRAAGRLAEARVEALRAVELDGGKDPLVARTAQEMGVRTSILQK